MTCKGITEKTLVRLIAAAMAIGGMKANARNIETDPELKMRLVPILADEKVSYFNMINRAKAASCPVKDRFDFSLDLEEPLKIKNPNIENRIRNSCIMGKWDRIAVEIFNYNSYEEFIEFELNNTTFFGQILFKINDEMIKILNQVEKDLIDNQAPGYKAPLANSTLREKSGMHGWGMAIDFDVGMNPYVLNEKSEGELDKVLIGAYDNIAKLMLGKNESDLRKLKIGRTAFGNGSIGDVYDILREESDAMKRYFLLMNDNIALQEFIETEWAVKNPDTNHPDFAAIKAQMENDYRILGGKTDTGNVWRTETREDPPFAPNSMGGTGDPATGFLNLRKEFVEAMVNSGFAWGAIDISGEPGDIQHFDLRLQGVGARVYDLLLKYK
jgi:hypothetical protein